MKQRASQKQKIGTAKNILGFQNNIKSLIYRFIYRFKKSITKYRLELIVFLSFFLYLVILRFIIPYWEDNDGIGDGDWDMYIKMSRDIFSIFKRKIVPPFCYRPLIPFIAGILPFDIQTNYSIITFISVFGTGVFLYLTLGLKFNKTLCVMGLFLFVFLSLIPDGIQPIFNYSFYGAYFYCIYSVDAPTKFLIMASFYCIFSSKKKGYLFCLVLGVLTKEFVIFTIPVFLIYECLKFKGARKPRDWLIILARNGAYVIPSLIVLLVVHFTVVPKPASETLWYFIYGGAEYGSIEMIQIFWEWRIDEIFNNASFLPITLVAWSAAILPFLLLNKTKNIQYWAIVHGVFVLFTCIQLELGFDTALLTWSVGVWSPIIVSFCLLNESTEIRHWILVHGFFMVFVYAQLVLGIAAVKYIQYGFYPVIYCAISGLNNVFYASMSSDYHQCDFITINQSYSFFNRRKSKSSNIQYT